MKRQNRYSTAQTEAHRGAAGANENPEDKTTDALSIRLLAISTLAQPVVSRQEIESILRRLRSEPVLGPESLTAHLAANGTPFMVSRTEQGSVEVVLQRELEPGATRAPTLLFFNYDEQDLNVPERRFEGGDVFVSRTTYEQLGVGEQPYRCVLEALKRHYSGDWGEYDDPEGNEESLRDGDEIVSLYEDLAFPRLLVVTTGDRSWTQVTTREEWLTTHLLCT